MKVAIVGLLGVGGLGGAYALTDHGLGQRVERVVDRSPQATYDSFNEALRPLAHMEPRDRAIAGLGGPEAMTFGYKTDPGKHIRLSVLMNGSEVADMDFDFAPAPQPNRTTMTVTMAPGAEAPPQMQLALALADHKTFERMIDKTVQRVEMGMPVAPEFARLGQSQDYVSRSEGLYSARNPEYKVMEQDYARQRAQDAAAAPSQEAGRPMLDPSRPGY